MVTSVDRDSPCKELTIKCVDEWQSRLFLTSSYDFAVVKVKFDNGTFC